MLPVVRITYCTVVSYPVVKVLYTVQKYDMIRTVPVLHNTVHQSDIRFFSTSKKYFFIFELNTGLIAVTTAKRIQEFINTKIF